MPRPRSTAGAATQTTSARETARKRAPSRLARETDNDVQVQERRPGEGPDTTADDQLREQFMRERARREFVTASLRSHLAEQPNPRAVRACARRWADAITHLADETIADLNQEHE